MIAMTRLNKGVVVALVMIGVGCHPGGDAKQEGDTVTVHACLVTTGETEIPDANVTIGNPSECPISISTPGTRYEYTALGKYAVGTFWENRYNPQAVLEIYDANGVSVGQTNGDSWVIISTSCTLSCPPYDEVQFHLYYPVGSAGFSVPAQEDRAYHHILIGDTWRTAIGHLTYQNAPGLSIAAPEDVMPNTSYDVVASLHDAAFVPPITWQWSDDGVPLSYSGKEFTWPGSPMGTLHYFQVTVSDANGLSWTEVARVWTKTCDTPGCADQ